MDGEPAVLERLLTATNKRDIEGLVACFAEDYVNETPAYPARDFQGRQQVRRNWTQIFEFVPDLRAEVVRRAVDGASVWTEWDMQGTRRDGTRHWMTGVIVFGVADELIQWGRFYLEPVDEDHATVDDAVRKQVVRE